MLVYKQILIGIIEQNTLYTPASTYGWLIGGKRHSCKNFSDVEVMGEVITTDKYCNLINTYNVCILRKFRLQLMLMFI